MKISLNWLKQYVTIPETVSNEELIRLIGARLVEVEGVIDESYKYDNIYIVRVETCEKIPETHLTLCHINAGGPELVQVVCGAPNVRDRGISRGGIDGVDGLSQLVNAFAAAAHAVMVAYEGRILGVSAGG